MNIIQITLRLNELQNLVVISIFTIFCCCCRIFVWTTFIRQQQPFEFDGVLRESRENLPKVLSMIFTWQGEVSIRTFAFRFGVRIATTVILSNSLNTDQTPSNTASDPGSKLFDTKTMVSPRLDKFDISSRRQMQQPTMLAAL